MPSLFSSPSVILPVSASFFSRKRDLSQLVFRNLRSAFIVSAVALPSTVSFVPGTTLFRNVCNAVTAPDPKLLPVSFFLRNPAFSQLSFIHLWASDCVAWSNSPDTSSLLMVAATGDARSAAARA